MSYNGWSNYETWCVNLWLSNDEGTYHDCLAIGEGCLEDGEFDEYDCAKQLENYVEEMVGVGEVSGLAGDLLGAALSEVDWDEIAPHWNPDEQ